MAIYKQGNRGGTVLRIQRKVGTTPDGVWGPVTTAAVKRWQKAHRLTADGVVGPKTMLAMFPAAPKRGRLAGRVIINDIGHGVGNRSRGVYDPGAVAGGKQEHREVEAFVDALSAAERAQGASVGVIEDTPLGQRKAKSAADATSWHMNAGGGTGVEVLVPWLAGKASRAKSDRIGRALAAALDLPYRGIKRSAHLAVLNNGFDRLVEIIFLDSAADRAAFAARHDKAIAAIVANI